MISLFHWLRRSLMLFFSPQFCLRQASVTAVTVKAFIVTTFGTCSSTFFMRVKMLPEAVYGKVNQYEHISFASLNTYFRYDAPVMLSRNRLVDDLEAIPKRTESLKSINEKIISFSKGMVDRTDYHLLSNKDLDLNQLWCRADRMRKDVNDLCGQGRTNYPLYSWTRSEQEPAYGICDIIACREATLSIPAETKPVVMASFLSCLTFIDGSRCQVRLDSLVS